MTRQSSLPDRVWSLLHRDGPSYPCALARQLGARDAAVSGALRSLVRQGRAAYARRDGRRVIYQALGQDPRPPARRSRPDSLPERVWRLLHSAGPCYAQEIADLLEAGAPQVSGALGSLKRRDRVAVAHRDGRRVYYAARGDEPVQREAPDRATSGRLDPPREVDPRPLPESLSALDVEISLLRAAEPAVEIEALIATNRGLCEA